MLYHIGERALSVRVWEDSIKEGDPELQIVRSMEETGKRQRPLEGKHREGKLEADRHQFNSEEQRQ